MGETVGCYYISLHSTCLIPLHWRFKLSFPSLDLSRIREYYSSSMVCRGEDYPQSLFRDSFLQHVSSSNEAGKARVIDNGFYVLAGVNSGLRTAHPDKTESSYVKSNVYRCRKASLEVILTGMQR